MFCGREDEVETFRENREKMETKRKKEFLDNRDSCKTIGNREKLLFRASETRPGIQGFQRILDSGFRRNDGVRDFCKSLNRFGLALQESRLEKGGRKMARLLKCEDIGIECDYICADSEEDLFNRAAQYAKMDERSIEMPSEFRDRVVSLSRPIDHC